MPTITKPLTPTTIGNLKSKTNRYPKSDGGCTGLFIEVMPSGSKIWRYRYTLNGERQSPVTIGSYPEITRALGLSVYASSGLVQGTESLGYP